jgi:predicted transcriptional regulator
VGARRRELGRLESEVLAVVASSDEPMTVTQVQQRLPGEPAYTTVMTTLARLATKGALSRVQHGRAYHYRMAAPVAAIDEALTAREMRRLLSGGADRAAVLARFVADLDANDERLLAELLERHRRANGPES